MSLLNKRAANKIIKSVDKEFGVAPGLLEYLDALEGGRLAFGLIVNYAKAAFPSPMVTYLNLAKSGETDEIKIVFTICLFTNGENDEEYERRFHLYEGTMNFIPEVAPLREKVLFSLLIFDISDLQAGLLASRGGNWELAIPEVEAEFTYSPSSEPRSSEEEEMESAMMSASMN